MEKSKSKEMHLIWAVDPFAKDAELQRNAGWAIKTLVRKEPASVEPVYVATDPRFQIPPKLRVQFARQIGMEAQDEIDEWTARIRIPGLMETKALGPSSSSVRERVEILLEYAREAKADLIVASTRARKGPSRWFFGSFVETLSLISEIPLLVVNPTWDRRAGFDRILFPTDFSDESHEALLALIPHARRMKSRILLFHKLTLGMVAIPDVPMSMMPVPQEEFDAELANARRKLDLWIREVKRTGVQTEGLIDTKQAESVTTTILRISRREDGIIALAGESNRVEATLLGSVTRQLLREAHCPVWVIRPTRWAAGEIYPRTA